MVTNSTSLTLHELVQREFH